MKKGILTVLPFWSPLIPPKGLGALKTYVEQAGHKIYTFDLTNKIDLLEAYYNYFDYLKRELPERNLGNFYNVGHDLIANHLMALIHATDLNKLNRLISLLVYDCYLFQVSDTLICELNAILKKYLHILEKFILFQVKYEKPDIIGFTVYKTNIPSTLYIAKSIKEKYPKKKIVIGGGAFADSHAISSPNFNILCDLTQNIVDYIVVGQGEKVMLDIFEGRVSQGKRIFDVSMDTNKQLSFDQIKMSNYEDFNLFKYAYMPVTASQGCPFKCSFCNQKLFYGNYLTRNASDCVDEMVKLNKLYKKQLFFMTDSFLNPVVNELSNEIIKRELSFYYDSFFRVDKDAMNIEMTTKWRRGGLYRVRLGLESGSDKILALMDKKLKVKDIKLALQAFSYAGIKTTTYWIVGFPGETEDDFQMTLDFITENIDYIYEAECNPFRYFVTNQNGADEWFNKKKKIYPDWVNELLKFAPYELDIEPNRHVTTERVFRFVEHCKKLGLPNIYSTAETDLADKRWQQLHHNAVPNVLDFDPEAYVTENIKIQQYGGNPLFKSDLEEIDFKL